MDFRVDRFHDRKILRWAIGIAVAVVVLLVIGCISTYTAVGKLFANIGISLLIGYLVMADIFTCFCDTDSFSGDIFACSIKGFTMPGLIFTLDLDGIIWFICVKLLLSLLSILLSLIWFSAVVAFGTLVSAVSFPFVLWRAFRA